MQNKSIYTRLILKAQKFINEGIVIIDAGGKDFPILFINKGFKKVTGYPSKELIGKGIKIFQNEKSTPANLKKFKNVFIDKKNITTDLYLKKSNEQFCYCRISVSFIPLKSNSAGYFLLVVRDITDIRKAMINELKLDVVKTTLRSVNDIVYNYMQGLQLFRYDCEKHCNVKLVKFDIFDKQYASTLKNLQKLNQMQEYKENKIGGSGSTLVMLAHE